MDFPEVSTTLFNMKNRFPYQYFHKRNIIKYFVSETKRKENYRHKIKFRFFF